MNHSTKSKPLTGLIQDLKHDLNQELQAYAQQRHLKLLVTAKYDHKYGKCLIVYRWYEDQFMMVYNITAQGSIIGTNSLVFLRKNPKIEDICCKYLCKMIRSFN